jgi:hypothetical protein
MLKRAKRLLLVLSLLAYLLFAVLPVSTLAIILSAPYWIITGNSTLNLAEDILSPAWAEKFWIWLIS